MTFLADLGLWVLHALAGSCTFLMGFVAAAARCPRTYSMLLSRQTPWYKATLTPASHSGDCGFSGETPPPFPQPPGRSEQPVSFQGPVGIIPQLGLCAGATVTPQHRDPTSPRSQPQRSGSPDFLFLTPGPLPTSGADCASEGAPTLSHQRGALGACGAGRAARPRTPPPLTSPPGNWGSQLTHDLLLGLCLCTCMCAVCIYILCSR